MPTEESSTRKLVLFWLAVLCEVRLNANQLTGWDNPKIAMVLFRMIGMLVLVSSQRLESPDGDCEQGFVCKPSTDCPFYEERKELLASLRKSGRGVEYDTLLASLKDLVCNKANRGVCCLEHFELVNGQIVESVEEMPFMARLRLKDTFGSFSICGATVISSQFLLSAKHCFANFWDECIYDRDCVAYFRDFKVSGWDDHEIGQFYIPIVDIFERKGISDLVLVKLKHKIEEHEDYSLGVPIKPIKLAKEAPKAGEVTFFLTW